MSFSDGMNLKKRTLLFYEKRTRPTDTDTKTDTDTRTDTDKDTDASQSTFGEGWPCRAMPCAVEELEQIFPYKSTPYCSTTKIFFWEASCAYRIVKRREREREREKKRQIFPYTPAPSSTRTKTDTDAVQ